jgi:hypothetical protein
VHRPQLGHPGDEQSLAPDLEAIPIQARPSRDDHQTPLDVLCRTVWAGSLCWKADAEPDMKRLTRLARMIG